MLQSSDQKYYMLEIIIDFKVVAVVGSLAGCAVYRSAPRSIYVT